MRRRRLLWIIAVLASGGLLLLVVDFDPDFCEHRCPICARARQGSRWARFLQSVEMVITFGGCPWGRARQRKYGVRPDEPVPPKPRTET